MLFPIQKTRPRCRDRVLNFQFLAANQAAMAFFRFSSTLSRKAVVDSHG